VLAQVGRGERVLDALAIALGEPAFARGSLRVTSYARPGKLFTASDDLTGQPELTL